MLYLWYHKNNGVMFSVTKSCWLLIFLILQTLFLLKMFFLFHTFSVGLSFWDLVTLLHVNLGHCFWLFYCTSSYTCNIFYVPADVMMHNYAPTSICYKQHSDRNLHAYFLADPWEKQVMMYSSLLRPVPFTEFFVPCVSYLLPASYYEFLVNYYYISVSLVYNFLPFTRVIHFYI